MKMPFIASRMPRSRYIWIGLLSIAIVSVWASVGQLRVSAQKNDPVTSKIYVRGAEPGTADQNSSFETFKIEAGSNETNDLSPRDAAASAVRGEVASSLRISQIYTRGGEAGATYQNDFVEVFNAGTSAVDINGWAMVVNTFEGTNQQAIGARFNSSFTVPPGMHLLFRFNGNGTAGQPVPGEYPIITDISLGSTSGQVMLLSPSQNLPTGCPASFSEGGAVTDFVGYGTSACFEGSPAPVPPANKSLTRLNGGCTDTDNNASDFALLDPSPRISTSALTPCGGSTPQTPVLNFSAAQYTVGENAGNATITVIRSGVVSVPVTVNFATANGTATAGSDYTAASGTLSFAANELQKTFNVPITDDSAVESSETVSLTLSNPTGTAILGSPSTATLTIQDNDSINPPPSNSNSNLRISQIYTRGGEAGATYQNDFVEVFNAGSTAVDINGWAMVVITFEGTTQQAIGSRFNSSFSVPPGMHLLFRFNGNGTAGQPVPGEFPIITDISLGSTSGQIMLLSPSQNLPTGCPTSFGLNGAVTDFVGYGTSACFEGAPAPVPAANQSLTRIGGGCTDTDNNANDFALVAPNPRISTSALTPCGSTTPTTPVLNFSAAQYTVSENAGNATITVIRSGIVSVPVTVNFATANGTATAGSDYTAASGTLSFAANELQKTFNVPITDDSAVESSETVSLTLSNPTGTAVLGSPSTATLTIQDNDSTNPPPGNSNSNLRISQIYTRGGEAGATYQNDFVEVFNAGSTAVDINGWAMVVNTFEGTTQQAIGARFNSSFSVPPGMHLLFRFNGNGTAGQPVPGEYPIITDISLGSTSGQIMLLSPSQSVPAGCPASFGLNGAVTDFVGYGTSACFEGSPAPVPPANKSLTRLNGGCTDTDNNASDFALVDPSPRISTSALTPCGSTTPTTPVLNFSAAQYTVAENAGKATITVTRSGIVSVPVTVNFATANGTATAGSDYTAASGTLSFAANELQKTFDVPITDDSAVESNETVSLTLTNPTGTAVLGSPSSATLTIQDNDGIGPPLNSNATLRISQVYTRGGEAGATFQNDYVEVFNAGTTAVNINGWAMVVITLEGTTQQAIGSRFNSNFSMPPGMHLLFRFNGNGTAGQPVPGEYPVITDISLGSTSGQIMLLSPTQALPSGCPTSFGPSGAVTDLVGYGTSACFEGAPAPVPPADLALTRIGGGCTDTDNNASDFALRAPSPRISSSPLSSCGQFSSELPAPVVNSPIAETSSFSIIGTTNFAIIGKTSAFVDQHYHDFLSRVPDTSGLEFWVNNIESCGSNVQCREVKRIDTSASFFLSLEFQQTGYLVERFYKVGYGDGTGTSTFGGQHQLQVPIVRMNEFLTDTQRIGRGVVVLAAGWEELLANNKQAYAQEFVQTTRFTTKYPTTMTPAQFVDTLNSNAGNVLSATERTTAIALFKGAANSSDVSARAQAVRQVAEDTDLYNAELNRGFVMAEYFGYLRRNPNEGPDNDFTGYDFWLTKLNQFGGDYKRAEMVKAFISSIEYSTRVGQ